MKKSMSIVSLAVISMNVLGMNPLDNNNLVEITAKLTIDIDFFIFLSFLKYL